MDSDLEKGIELIRQVENTAAIPFLERALNKQPQNPEILRHLGLAYFNLGNYTDALLNWEKAIELDPTHHQTFWNVGHLHEIEERYSDAFKAYSQAAVLAEKTSDSKKANRYKEWAIRVKNK